MSPLCICVSLNGQKHYTFVCVYHWFDFPHSQDLTTVRRLLVGREGSKCGLRISRDNIPFTVYLIREKPAESGEKSVAGSSGYVETVHPHVVLHHRQVEGDATVYERFRHTTLEASSLAVAQAPGGTCDLAWMHVGNVRRRALLSLPQFVIIVTLPAPSSTSSPKLPPTCRSLPCATSCPPTPVRSEGPYWTQRRMESLITRHPATRHANLTYTRACS